MTLDLFDHLGVADQKSEVRCLQSEKPSGDKPVKGRIREAEITRLLGVDIADPGADTAHLPLKLVLELSLRDRGAIHLRDLVGVAAGRDHIADAPYGEADDQQNGQYGDDNLANTLFHFFEQHSSSSTFPKRPRKSRFKARAS